MYGLANDPVNLIRGVNRPSCNGAWDPPVKYYGLRPRETEVDAENDKAMPNSLSEN